MSFINIIESKSCSSKKTAYLVLNGELQISFLKTQLKDKTSIYCVDGAFNTLKHCDLPCVEILGDLDSLERATSYPETRWLPDQNKTDLEKSLDYLASEFTDIDIYGASGKQMDHFLGNLSVAKKYFTELTIRFYDPKYIFFYTQCDVNICNVKNKMVSIIPFPTARSVTSKGLFYPLKRTDLYLGSKIGIRNQADASDVSINFEAGGMVIFIYYE